MPLYFFDIYDNDELMADEVGLELESLFEARDQAIALLPDLAREGLPDGEEHDYAAIVRCQDGRVRYRAKLLYRGEWVEPPSVVTPP